MGKWGNKSYGFEFCDWTQTISGRAACKTSVSNAKPHFHFPSLKNIQVPNPTFVISHPSLSNKSFNFWAAPATAPAPARIFRGRVSDNFSSAQSQKSLLSTLSLLFLRLPFLSPFSPFTLKLFLLYKSTHHPHFLSLSLSPSQNPATQPCMHSSASSHLIFFFPFNPTKITWTTSSFLFNQ